MPSVPLMSKFGHLIPVVCDVASVSEGRWVLNLSLFFSLTFCWFGLGYMSVGCWEVLVIEWTESLTVVLLISYNSTLFLCCLFLSLIVIIEGVIQCVPESVNVNWFLNKFLCHWSVNLDVFHKIFLLWFTCLSFYCFAFYLATDDL